MIWHPQIRPFIWVPLIINILLFVILTSIAVNQVSGALDFFDKHISDWLKPLMWIAWIVIASLGLLIYGYSFNLITNFIAAPFYGVLSERAEQLVCDIKPPPETLWQMIPRVFSREFRKLLYFLVRGFIVTLLIILVASIPVVGIIAPLIGLAWGAWAMSIQYVDYPADNHQLSFRGLRKKLRKKSFSSIGFGGAVMGATLIPIVNVFVMPAAVVGGTLFWAHELKMCDEHKEKLDN